MKTLADIPPELAWQAQQAALMRLQLYLVGRTHEMLRGVLAGCREALGAAEGQRGKGAEGQAWDGLATLAAIDGVTQAWRQGFAGWRELFEGLRWEAAALPFGTLAVLHGAAFGAAEERRSGGAGGQGLQEAEKAPQVVFEPQLRAVLDASRKRVYGDGFNLSQRVWRLDAESLEEIKRIVYETAATGDSAWNAAKKLEPLLGAGARCPRWTRSRLYGLTKKEIASGDRTGLYSGEECAGQGVAYKALRLARNEIQIAHHMATREVQDKIAWIEQVKINLSPAHPEEDICDEWATGGPNGDGVYAKADVPLLPAHPQCLCYQTAVLLPPNEFAGRLRGWMRGESEWPQMNQYATWLGVRPTQLASVSLAQTLAGSLVTWLWGDQAAMDAAAARWLLPAAQLVMPNL